MTVTVKMIAPGFAPTFTVTTRSATTYVSDVNGIIAGVSGGDVLDLQNVGCVVFPERPVVTLAGSSVGVIIPGAINIINSSAASTSVYAYTLAAPVTNGIITTIMQPSGSTAATTVTASSLCNINVTNTNATVLTFTGGGSVDLIAIGSTLYNIVNRTPSQSSAGAALVFQPASS